MLSVRRRRRVLFDGHAKFIKFAFVACILRCDAFRNHLRALELRASIEKTALFAGVQFKRTFCALAIGIKSRRQHRSAIRATASGHRAHHARGPRTKLIRAARPALRRPSLLKFISFFFFFVFFRVTISAVAVLSIHKRLRPSVATDCPLPFLCKLNCDYRTVVCIRSDCYTRSGSASDLRTVYSEGRMNREQKKGHLCF